MNKAIKYRIYPDKSQADMIIRTFGCCRKVYNLMLEDKINHYNQTGKMLLTTPAQYKSKYPYLKEVDSMALCNEQLNLQRAYKNFFNNNAKFPKFKSKKHGRQSYTTNNINNNIRLEDSTIKLPKIGLVKAKLHRLPANDWKLKSATVTMTSSGKFYVSVLFEYTDTIIPVTSTNAIGLDYKSDSFYMDSNGNKAPANHKFFRESQKKLAKAQKKLKNKHKDSKNYRKQQKRIAKIHEHIANQRSDYLHKLSAEITNQYDIVCIESLNMKAISNKHFGNGKATMDNGYGMFIRMLEYKLKSKGKHLIKVDKWYPSSQLYSNCGHRQPMPLGIRDYDCPVCNIHMDRDKNAAINILHEGLRIFNEIA